MKNILKLEELFMFALCAYALHTFDIEWWIYPILLLGPDISMLGYLAGNKAGAFCYDLFHHKGAAVIIFSSGLLFQNEVLQIAGIILFGHSSMDRIFGYGLKYSTGFKFTHLGEIGKK